MTDKIEVSQRARDTAAKYYEHRHPADNTLPDFMRDGKADGSMTVQAFARFERDILASTADAQPVAWMYGRANFRLTRNFDSSLSETPLYAHPPAVPDDGLVEALERIADERTLQSDLPGLPWTAQDIAALQSREIVLMRDIARAALTAYQEQCDAE